MSERGTLIVYSGPSGVGKGTLLKPYLESHPSAVLSVSVTTRAPRPGETDGVEYAFVTEDRFRQLVERDGLLEHARYNGHGYGTPRAAVEEQLERGLDVVLEIEVQGAMQIKRTFPEAVFVFILPPSFEALRARLTGRGTEPPEVVEARLETARFELSFAGRYDYVIVNDDLEAAGERLAAVILAAKCRTRNMMSVIERMNESHEHA